MVKTKTQRRTAVQEKQDIALRLNGQVHQGRITDRTSSGLNTITAYISCEQ